MNKGLKRLMSIFITTVTLSAAAYSQTTAFTYQGKLTDGGSPPTGQYDFVFRLYDQVDIILGSQIGSDVLSNDVQVSAGIFTVNLDFGASPFASGADRYLQISVRPGASTGAYTPLAPLQPLTSAPFSIKAANSTSADLLSAACVLCVTDGHIVSIDGSKVTGTVTNALVPTGNISGVLTASQGGTGIGPGFPPPGPYLRSNGTGWGLSGLSGDGSGLTNLNGTSVTGTVANATNAVNATNATTAGNVTGVVQIANGGTGSTTQNFVDMTTNQRRIGGDKEFVGAVSVAGSNGVFNGNGSQLTNLNGANVTGTVANATNATTAGNVTGMVAIANGGTGSTTQNFADLTTDQTVAGNKTFAGTLSGNGSELTNLNGANITNNTINASALASDTFPNNRKLSLLGSLRWDILGKRVAVGSLPTAVAFDGANIWVTNNLNNNVSKIRASDGAFYGNTAVGFQPQGIAFDGEYIWVVNGSSHNVTKLRASDGALEGTFAVGTDPRGVAFDGQSIWVANSFSNNVTKLSASDGALQGTFAVGTKPHGVAFDGQSIWVANSMSNNVTKLRASDGSVQGTFAVGTSPQGLAFDGANIWITTNAAVVKLGVSNGVILGTFAVGSSPQGVAFDGANIWVTNFGSNDVTKLRASDGVNLGTFPVGTGPMGVAFDGVNIWVTNLSGNTVTKLPVFP